jgi:TonB-dependent receptor
MVSSNDGRAVEYDQFPSELIGSGTVYKTPNAALIGQGLSGTVDLRARRPLDTRGREIAVNARLEGNSNGTQVPDVASPIGKRFSLSYVNQFADNTFGVAVGFAHLESTSQVKISELDNYGDYTPYGVPINGIPPSLVQAPSVTWGPTSNALLPMFWTGSQLTKKNTRDGLMAVLEYKPNKDLRTQLDLYYSKFDTHEVGGKLTSNMFASWGQLFGGPNVQNTLSNVGTTQVGQNTYATTATASALPTTTTNWDTKRSDTIKALGWNTSFKADDKWTLVSDLSYSKDVRDEKYQEVYAGPWNATANTWAYGPFTWNVPVNGGAQTFTPVQSGFLSNPNGIKFGDVIGFDYVPGDPQWTGVIRDPHVTDEIKTLRLSAKRTLDGIFSAFTGGFNYTQRDKDVAKNETRLIIPLDANSSTICASSQKTAGPCNRNIPAGAIRAPLDMSWMGVPQFIRIDVPYLVDSGALGKKVAELGLKTNDSAVHEKVTTAFAMLDIETEVAGIPLRGNVGVQAVKTKQESEGWEYRGNNDNVDFNLLFKRTGGASYNEVLPSLNLVAELKNDLLMRFGLGTTTARPEINDLRAGTSTPFLLSTDPLDVNTGGYWSTAYAGNPQLKPWKAHAIDLSIEKYFGKRSYVSFAAFRKNLVSYITYATSARDNSSIPLPANLPPTLVVQQFGPVFQPVNGSGGKLEGLELAASLEGALVSPMLDGFGVVVSASKLRSSIRDQKVDQNSNQVIPGSSTSIDGLSGLSNNLTFYYEKYGFSARVSQRYRSAFTATTRDIFFRPTTRSQGSDKVVDMQIGYNFDDGGMYKGLSILLQVNNLTDTVTRNYKTPGNVDVPDPTQLVPNYTYKFGRQTLVGMNYKF